jgi:hypothetical protein
MDLHSATWMVRSLGEPVSTVLIDEEAWVFAGGWNGLVACWDGEGNSLWTVQTEDRIGAFALEGNLLIAASGLHIVALERATGKQRWSVALEGSADSVAWWEGDIVAVSSVYDIEHNDFIESAVWRFTDKGQQVWVERMDERPWALLTDQQHLVAGLGRPKCGTLMLNEGPPFPHTNPPTSSPTTAGGVSSAGLLFGQADGTVYALEGAVRSTETGPIEHLTCMVKGYVATTDTGHAVGRNDDGTPCWEAKGPPVSAQMEAFAHDGASVFWMARNQGLNTLLEAWGTDQQGRLTQGEFSRIHAMHGTSERAGVGCEDGTVAVWDRTMLKRRLQQSPSEAEPEADARSSALQAKLRALRQTSSEG